MKFLLIRDKPDGDAVRGKIYFANGLAPVGERMLEEQERGWTFLCSTLENLDYIIPAGTYPLTVTYSPKFKRPLPLICNVPKTSTQQTQHRQLPHIGNCRQGAMWAQAGVLCSPVGSHDRSLKLDVADDCVKYRSGIRIHPGSKPEHSRGCILVKTRSEEEAIKSLILKEKEAFIDVSPEGLMC